MRVRPESRGTESTALHVVLEEATVRNLTITSAVAIALVGCTAVMPPRFTRGDPEIYPRLGFLVMNEPRRAAKEIPAKPSHRPALRPGKRASPTPALLELIVGALMVEFLPVLPALEVMAAAAGREKEGRNQDPPAFPAAPAKASAPERLGGGPSM